MTESPFKLDEEGNPIVVDGRLVRTDEDEAVAETVRVKVKGGDFALISKADFDPKAHKLFDKTSSPAPEPEPAAPARRGKVARMAAERSIASAAPVGSTVSNRTIEGEQAETEALGRNVSQDALADVAVDASRP